MHLARQHYSATSLVTDDEGSLLLVDRLGLPFDEVTTQLNSIRSSDPSWWTLGKLIAYRSQSDTFVHLDSDVYLWKPLPPKLLESRVFFQSPEPTDSGSESWHAPSIYGNAVLDTGLAMREWNWYAGQGGDEMYNTGIIGGQDIDFIRRASDAAIELMDSQSGRRLWQDVRNKAKLAILFEQFMMRAFVAYEEQGKGAGSIAATLFDSFDSAFEENIARANGFTHLLSSAKRNENLLERLEVRVSRDYPTEYRKALQLVAELGLQ